MPLSCRRLPLPRLLFALLAALSLVAPALAPSPARAKSSTRSLSLGDRALRQGASGADVRELQRLLREVGMKVKADGRFGASTKSAVKAFQQAAHLQASGTVGKLTVSALRQAAQGGAATNGSVGGYDADTGGPKTHSLGDRIPLKQGMSGHDVKVLQDYLTRVDQPVTKDGEFGPSTTKAEKAFEAAEGLPVDGIVDANDIAVLRGQVDAGPNAASAAAPTALAPGDTATIGPDGLALAPASAPDAVKQMIAAGNKIAKTPYVYGGGHGKWEDSGYDCSGSVSYALHGAGLLDKPLVSGDFPAWGTPGPGQWVTIYGNSGHVFMVVAGLRFDTSGAKQDGTRWHTDMRPTKGYGVSHPTGL